MIKGIQAQMSDHPEKGGGTLLDGRHVIFKKYILLINYCPLCNVDRNGKSFLGPWERSHQGKEIPVGVGNFFFFLLSQYM